MNKTLNKLSTIEQISFLQRWIIIHSIIYYHLNSNLVSDKLYDSYARYLEKLIKLNEKEFKQSQYYYAFIDYTSDTGFDLYDKLNDKDKEYLLKLSKYILNNGKVLKEKGIKR